VSDTLSLRLPAGMRDFAPRAAATRRRIAETLLSIFESWGYARVITPAFEYEDVLGLGLGPEGRAATLRFVEPSSGRVVALRPDFTPQIARLISTRFRDETGPIRLCYEGPVLRLERGARSQRELIQAGVELAGVGGPHGDADVIALGAAALAAVGLAEPEFDLTIDLGHLGLTREILAALALSPEGERAVRAAIAKRDPSGLDDALKASSASPAVLRFVRALPDLSGDPAILKTALRQAPSTSIRRALAELQSIVDAVTRRAPRARLHVDLTEVRGFDYYTGMRFQIFAAGAAEPVLQGGRYDDLLGRYGRTSPAVGFAVDVEAAAGALEVAASAEGARKGDDASASRAGVLVIGAPEQAAARAAELRAQGRAASTLLISIPPAQVAAYAARWGYGEVMDAGGATASGAKRTAGSKPNVKKGLKKR
jgi:ATP phosphoribosyltransferase regulatory subunit